MSRPNQRRLHTSGWLAIRLLLPLVAVFWLNACGQRGDLTLPQEEPKPDENAQQATTP